jgi:ubiquinone/menaquinone biosynthesis C-methylase UbiE
MLTNKMLELVLTYSEKPKLYEEGTHFMWTESHIQPFLLEAHLNQNNDAASRTKEKVDQTIDFVLKGKNQGLSILDLGCGPGLYIKKYAKKGYKTYGIDISSYSLSYANQMSNDLDITLIEGNYLDTIFPSDLDIITLIYCDFGVLTKDHQKLLLKKIFQSLKKGGQLVLDFYNMNKMRFLSESSSYEVESFGFWRPNPYIALNHRFHYANEKAFLDQHIIVDKNVSLYRFYNHYYEESEMNQMIMDAGFSKVKFFHDVIDEKDTTFLKATK